MKICKFFALVCMAIVILLTLFDQKVFALAGLGEFSSTFYYNNYAELDWRYPSDGCRGYSPYGQNCFYLIEKNNLKKPFHETLQKISLPQGSTDSMVLMESTHSRYFGQGIWVIYDLASEGIILETEDFETALRQWKKMGLSDPKLINVTQWVPDYFEETEESKASPHKQWEKDFALFMFKLGIISSLILIFANVWLARFLGRHFLKA